MGQLPGHSQRACYALHMCKLVCRSHAAHPLPSAQKVHHAAHTIKGAARQVYCVAFGNAAEAVEHAVRLARDIVRDPELAATDERT